MKKTTNMQVQSKKTKGSPSKTLVALEVVSVENLKCKLTFWAISISKILCEALV